MTGTAGLTLITRPLALVASLLAGVALAGCDHKPSEDECEAAADKFMELIAEREGVEARGDSEEKMRDQFKEACVTDGTTKEVVCIQEASAFDDLERCQKLR